MTGAYQFLKKNGVAIGFGLGAVLSVLTYAIIQGGYPDFNPSNEELYKLSIFNFGLYTTYALLALACVAVVLFSLFYVAKNPKESLKGLIGFGILLAVFGITYSMGDGLLTDELVNSDATLMTDEKFVPGESFSGNLQFADGMIKFAYFMLGGAGLAVLFAIGRDFIKQS